MEQCVHWSGFWNTKFVEGKFLSHVWLKWHCLATVTKLALNLEAAKSYDQNINRATVQGYIRIEFLVSCLFRFLVLSTHHELHPNWCNFTPISFFTIWRFFLQWNKSCRAQIWPCTGSNRHDDRCFTETGTKLFSAAFIRQQRPSDLCDRVTGASCLYIYWLAFYCVARWNRCSIFPFFFFLGIRIGLKRKTSR